MDTAAARPGTWQPLPPSLFCVAPHEPGHELRRSNKRYPLNCLALKSPVLSRALYAHIYIERSLPLLQVHSSNITLGLRLHTFYHIMFQSLPAIRASFLYGLLAAPSLSLVSASPSPIDARHVVTDPARVVAQATVTAVSECHAHGTNYYCQAGVTEFRIVGSETAASYTDCHPHGAKT